MRVLSLLALAAPLVSAIQFTEPIANSTLKKGETYNVKWDSVDTDPTTFSIYLVNFVDWPPFYTQVASGVQTTDGSHEVTVPCDVNTSWGFQFNAINGTNVYVIHAQTSKFFVRDGACSGSGPTEPEETPAPTCEHVTVTATATTTVTVWPSCGATDPPAGQSTSTTVAVPPVSFSESESPAQPTVTSPPSAEGGAHSSGTTSTVYSTRYIDLSEAQDCDASCVAH